MTVVNYRPVSGLRGQWRRWRCPIPTGISVTCTPLPLTGATITSARFSRYVVDLNRDPSGKSLYPGADTTEVCPTSTFHKQPIYREGQEPDAREIDRRLKLYWQSYHAELGRVITEQQEKYGTVLLFDAHSIGSELPRFFEGRLPDFNLGTADGASADPGLTGQMFYTLDTARYTAVLNGRFKGGCITRHYGNPDAGIHAIRLNGAVRLYDEDAPYRFRPDSPIARLVPQFTGHRARGPENGRSRIDNADLRFRSSLRRGGGCRRDTFLSGRAG